MIQAILMTDMASHFDLAKKLESSVAMLPSPDSQGNILEQGQRGGDPAFTDSPEDTQLLIDLILHSADIGAQVLPVPIANKWSQAVLEEFQEVHEAEKQRRLTPFIIGLDEHCERPIVSWLYQLYRQTAVDQPTKFLGCARGS